MSKSAAPRAIRGLCRTRRPRPMIRPVICAPRWAATTARGGLGLIIGGAVALGLLAFIFLSSQRHAPERAAALANGPTAEVLPPPPTPSDITTTEAAARGAHAADSVVHTADLADRPSAGGCRRGAPSRFPPNRTPSPSTTAALGRKAPTLVVDLGEGPPPVGSGTAGAAAGRNRRLRPRRRLQAAAAGREKAAGVSTPMRSSLSG